MKNNYILLISENKDADWNHVDMFRAKDKFFIELREESTKTLEKHVGTFKLDNSLKGYKNGYEIGLFTSNEGKQFVIYPDFSAVEYKR